MDPNIQQPGIYNDQVRKHNGFLGKLMYFVFFLIVISLSVGVGYLYFEYRESQKELEKLKDPGYYSQIQDTLANATVEKLATVMVLPQNENPTIATIVKAEDLIKENPEFYADIQNGDQIIMYSNRLIVFRESENKIVNASYFPAGSLDQSTSTGSEQTTNTSE
ncbi:hypothetical protein JW978_01820 [Candidatus Dojkabacteria bacterium]|nr:hypothetical protein [Candidatus Dojkabacteria bacterium]